MKGAGGVDLYLIFNHRITRLQEEDARRSLGIRQLVEPPEGLKELWRAIPPELPEIDAYLEPLRQWLAANGRPDDFVLIEGDFGACWLMVRFAFKQGLVPVYSTTLREAEEEYGDDGSVRLVHRFEHRIFRRYGR